MADIVIKVKVVKLGVTKAFQFDPLVRVEHVIQQIQEKVAGLTPKANENFGLFLRDCKNTRKSLWLLNSRNLKFYDIQNGSLLEYIDKNRYLKVKMLDGTIKTVLVDDSKSVGHALDIICEKIGLTNSDEYSLFLEEEKEFEEIDEAEDEALLQAKNVGTLRKMSNAVMHRVDAHEQKKIETLKRNAHTDNDTQWLRNEKTLWEAGVKDDSLVVIRRRFTYEQSVNITNPVEINLLYVQSKDAILDGSHPCSMVQAAKFAAFQIQIQHGNYDETRYKSGYIDVKECLPKDYHKNRDTVKEIKEAHKGLENMDDLDLKYKFIQLCQNLTTYGVTFFVVREKGTSQDVDVKNQEKMRGKNKLVPRLLGVNKESVMRVDEKTKEVMKIWPLTTIKNWASSPNSFTLDFGDYTEGMVSVQTEEGAQIGQLIGGYIDIIMRRMHKLKFSHVKDDELGVIGEESSVPHKMQCIQNKRRDLKETLPKYGKHAQMSGTLSAGQRALIDSLDNSGRAVLVMYDLEDENPYAELEPLRAENEGSLFDLDNSMADIYASVASVISKSNMEEEDDYTTVGDGVATITSNLKDLSNHLRRRANGLGDDDKNGLLDAARALADAFKDLMFCLNPLEDKPRNELYQAATSMSEAGVCIEHILNNREPNEYHAKLQKIANGIQKAAVLLRKDALRLAATLDPEDEAKVIKAADVACESAEELFTCTSMLSMYMDNPEVKKLMITAIQKASRDMNALTGLCLVAANDDSLLDKIKAVAQAVSDALDSLLQNVKLGYNQQPVDEDLVKETTEKNVYEMILDANDALLRNSNDADSMVKQATILGQATSQLIKGIEGHADGLNDNDDKDKLLAAARALTDATAALLTAAKRVKEDPTNESEKETLKTSAINLRITTNHATNNALNKTLVIQLSSKAKTAVQAATFVISSVKHAEQYNVNTALQQEFNEASSELVANPAKDLIRVVKNSEGKLNSKENRSNLVRSTKFFIPAASRIVALSKVIVPNITNAPAKKRIEEANVNAEKAIADLNEAIEKTAEGQDECDRVLTAINKSINDIDQAALAAISDNLRQKTDDSIKDVKNLQRICDVLWEKGTSQDVDVKNQLLEEKILSTCSELKDEIPDTVEYALTSDEKIGTSVLKLASLVHPLTDASIDFAASLSTGSSKQTDLLDMAKTVLESLAQLVDATKMSAGNPNVSDNQHVVDDAAENVIEALKDMILFVKATTGDMDNIAYLLSAITKVKDEVALNATGSHHPMKSYVEYQNNMFKRLKDIAKDAHEIVGKSQKDPKEVSNICENIYENYLELADDLKYAVVFVNPEIGDELVGHVKELGEGCTLLIKSAGDVQVRTDDPYTQQELGEKAKIVSSQVAQICICDDPPEKSIFQDFGVKFQVAQILTDLQRASVGTKACDEALTMLSGLIGDIDTNVMFAETGSLNSDDNLPFVAHRDVILLNSQNFVRETKVLVGAVHSAQDKLAASVTEVLNSTMKLIDSVKLGAASLGATDNEGQMLLLNAVKNVASALSDLMGATKNACGKSKDDPSADDLKVYAKHMVSNLTSLLKTVRSVEDTASRGSRAVESSIELIKQAVLHHEPEDDASVAKSATPEELIRSTKGITLATAKTVSAGNSLLQPDIIEAANLGRKSCIEIYETARAAIVGVEDEFLRKAVIKEVKGCVQGYVDILGHVATIKTAPSPQAKQHLSVLSKKIALSVGEVVKMAENLKRVDFVNPEDPNVIAEKELLEAAASIEAAAMKLAELKPKANPKAVDDSLNFEEQILEAATSITTATGALVKAATLAQRELVAQGFVCSPLTDHYADTQWSQGLISAARLVAQATSALCDAANNAVIGNASQENLIASAQAVSSSTTQLLVACRVKADQFSKTQKGLQTAGAAVKRATDHLVRAAEDAAVFEVDEVDSYVPSGGVRTGRLIDEMNAQVEILRREKELETARRKLEQIRASGYQNGWKSKDDDSSSDEQKTNF